IVNALKGTWPLLQVESELSTKPKTVALLVEPSPFAVGGGTSNVYEKKCRLLLTPLLPRIEHFMLVTQVKHFFCNDLQLIHAEARIDKKHKKVAN
ncbi:hypothetical protein Tco_0886352, partial [Tanacetum coccineum]